jgi:DMSO/TMAO reductase YedYZ molybdopterin-dependent catalytic subunit
MKDNSILHGLSRSSRALPSSQFVSHGPEVGLTRREWLSAAIASSSALLSGLGLVAFDQSPSRIRDTPDTNGQLLGSLTFSSEGQVTLDKPLGMELDGRLYTDLSQLRTSDIITPTNEFYVRTRASKLVNSRDPWIVQLESSKRRINLSIDEIIRESKPLGLHLMECAGNSRNGHFGLISAADWSGIPLLHILDQLLISDPNARIRVSGFDTYATQSTSSVAGASWIFSFDEIRATGAFLATGMNSRPLLLDHGAPVRLVVPGWYGCTCIKWVNEIVTVGGSAPPTSQMLEYATRTFQKGPLIYASQYEPPIIDAAAMPIRVEKWLANKRIFYQVAGIIWGGSKPVRSLWIQFNQDQYVQVENIFHAATGSWTMWSHRWSPEETGIYTIRLAIRDSGIRTKRLDKGYYIRSVEITDV